MSAHKETIRRALRAYRGDDLERAWRAWGGLSAAQMEEQHGASGRTRSELLAEWQLHSDEVDAALAWLESAQ